MKTSAQDRADAIAKLRELLPPGSTVYTILRHVSRSGMQRHISCYVIVNGEPRFLDHWISLVTGYRRVNKGEGLIVNGYGMDMGAAIVDDVAWALRDNPTESTVPHKLYHSWL